MNVKRAIKHKIWRTYSFILSKLFPYPEGILSEDLSFFARNSYLVKENILSDSLMSELDASVKAVLSDITKLNEYPFAGNHVKYNNVDIDELRNVRNFISVKDPFVELPILYKVLTLKYVEDLIFSILGTKAALTGINVRRSFVNDLPEIDTNLFHVDGNGGRVIKLFIYLDDVDSVLDGPTQIFRTSADVKPWNWAKSYRMSADELKRYYGEDSLVNLTNLKRGVQVADTTSFHRGLKVKSKDRFMVTFSFTNHVEYFNKKRAQKVLIDKNIKKSMFRYCHKVNS